ncbi:MULTISPECIES: DUF4244 domain-containing protein [unclassified Gordonia (in: high G+C Gram-positive bacteria)]
MTHNTNDIISRIRSGLDSVTEATARLVADDEGMSTAEYAIGTIAAAAFGAVLYTVISGDNIVSALTGIINKALNTSVG